MTKLVLSSISNCEDNLLGFEFDEIFARYQQRLNDHFAHRSGNTGSLGCVYVQFQFDPDWNDRNESFRIGRFSRKFNDIQATVRVTDEEFRSRTLAERKQLIQHRLLDTLSRVQGAIAGKVPNDISELLQEIRRLNDDINA